MSLLGKIDKLEKQTSIDMALMESVLEALDAIEQGKTQGVDMVAAARNRLRQRLMQHKPLADIRNPKKADA